MKVTSLERPSGTTVRNLAPLPRRAPPLLFLSFQHFVLFCSLYDLRLTDPAASLPSYKLQAQMGTSTLLHTPPGAFTGAAQSSDG